MDGVVLEGSSAVNESALTGESIPVDKAPGDTVSSATTNQSGFLKCEAVRVGEDTSLAQIISMVSDAAATKAPVAKLADTISGYFVPAVIALAVIVTILWLAAGQTVGYALARGICVLVVSCPCALGLATPVAIMVGNGMGAKHGILFKNAEALQETGNIQIVALDKTGTITNGEPVVTDIFAAGGISEKDLLTLSASLEQKSEHPLAKAVLSYAREKVIPLSEVTEFTAVPGNGLTAKMGKTDGSLTPFSGKLLSGGNEAFIRTKCRIPEEMLRKAGQLSEEGKTPLFFAVEKEFAGIVAVADTMKEDSASAIRELQNMGIHVVMLTGDNERTAKAIGRQAGVNEVAAGVLPEGKEAVIRLLQEKGKTAMVGDGINDAPALTRANIGIAIGAGTDVAIDAADVVLMKSRLTDVAAAVRLSRQTYRNIVENLFWALIYNTLLVPVAAGAFVHAFGLTMDPMFGAAAMSLSSFCVVTNALRLNLFKMYDASKDKKTRHPVRTDADGCLLPHGSSDKETMENTENSDMETKGKTEMTKTMKIEGMMCGHCEATVKKALEALDQVESAVVSHEAGTAVVTLKAEIADDVLKKAVEDKDYKVLGIE